MEWLSREEWEQRAAAHRDRLLPYVEPHLERRRKGIRHPVFDFLFTYYGFRPAQLLRWHPGYGIALEDAPEYLELKGYNNVVPQERHDFLFTYYAERPGRLRRWHPGYGFALPAGSPHAGWRGHRTDPGTGRVSVTETFLSERRVLVETLRRLLRATERRPAHTGCFGLHEWAMVHGQADGDVRHALPLRLGAAGTDRVVKGHRIACSHFDAFRFFTDTARPLNTLQPASGDRPDFEQPGCLHAGMDLYKHAYRLSPLVDSDLVLDCFALAVDIRELDMRASPYDLSGVADVDATPVRIETAEGKREYAAAQAWFAERAAPLRARLAAECERLLGLAERGSSTGEVADR